jgi:hypothetical protein
MKNQKSPFTHFRFGRSKFPVKGLIFFIFYKLVGSFSEESDKIGRGFIKILETWQFGLSFNIIRHVFFCFGQKIFLSVLWIFEKFWSCAKKNRKITLLAVNNAIFNRFSWLSTFYWGNLVIFWFLLHFDNFCKFSIFHGLFYFWSLTLEMKLLGTLKIFDLFLWIRY